MSASGVSARGVIGNLEARASSRLSEITGMSNKISRIIEV